MNDKKNNNKKIILGIKKENTKIITESDNSELIKIVNKMKEKSENDNKK